jgi:hypothetical protein
VLTVALFEAGRIGGVHGCAKSILITVRNLEQAEHLVEMNQAERFAEMN